MRIQSNCGRPLLVPAPRSRSFLHISSLFLVFGACLIAVCTHAQTSLDAVLAEYSAHLENLANAEAFYYYLSDKNGLDTPNGRIQGAYVGHWLYANGVERIDFRPDSGEPSHLTNEYATNLFRTIPSADLCYYNRIKNIALFDYPLRHIGGIENGRVNVRRWPPSAFLDHIAYPYGEKLVDMLKGNKTAQLISTSGKAEDPIVIRFTHPHNEDLEYEVSLMPSMGYLPVRRQIVHGHGRRVIVEDITHVLRNGVWFPAHVSFEEKTSDGVVNTHVTWVVTEARLNDPSFDVSRLKPELEKGTTIRNTISRTNVLLQSEAQVRSFVESFGK